MANRGVYGTMRPAIIRPNTDAEIFYNYRPTRAYDDANTTPFIQGSTEWLLPSTMGDGSTLHGMFSLKLPLSEFGRKGFYSIYIKPREIRTTIFDVSVLAAFPSVKGIILNIDDLPNGIEDLEGYRVEFVDGTERLSEFRIITSNGICEPIIQNLNNSNQKSVRYRYSDSGNLMFCTVSPSSAQSFKPNAIPFIGKTGMEIRLCNTFFNPICIEIEMVDRDIDTISTLLEGNQVRNLDTGLMTTYTRGDNEIFSQVEFATLKNQYSGKPMVDIKMNKENDIDFTQDWNTITEDL